MRLSSVGDAVASVPRQTAVVVGLISGSQFVNHVYLVLLPPILPLLARDFGVGIGQLGVALGVQALANTALQLPFGYLADHYDRTIALGLSSVLGGAGALLVAVAPDFATLLVAQVVLGVGVAGHHPSHYPLIADATPETARGRAFSVYNFGGSLGFATPPVVITAVIAAGLTWRHGVGLLAGAGLAYGLLVTGAFAWRVDDAVTAPNLSVADAGSSLGERVRSELRSLVAEPGILAVALLTLFASTASWAVTSYAVLFLTGVYGVSIGVANLTLTGLFVVGAGAILVGGHLTDRFGGGTVMVASYLGFTVTVGLIAARLVPALAAIGLFLLVGAVRSGAGPARDELTERLAPTGTVAKSFAVVTIGLMLGSTIAPPVFGYLIESVGLQATFYAVAAVGGVTTGLTVLVVAAYGDGSRGSPTPGD